ncbi:Panacea domain-containing protein [Bacillus sanguinis]
MTVDARMVAQYFLSRSTPNTDRSITHLKLQKLAYYAQAWHLALNGIDQPLFKDKIEAWVHGPVCPSLYSVFKGAGRFEIQPEEFPEELNSSENKKEKRNFRYGLAELWGIRWKVFGSINTSRTSMDRS